MISQAQEWQATFVGEDPENVHVLIDNTHQRLDARRHAILFNSLSEDEVYALLRRDTGTDRSETSQTMEVSSNCLSDLL